MEEEGGMAAGWGAGGRGGGGDVAPDVANGSYERGRSVVAVTAAFRVGGIVRYVGRCCFR
jgi:hypothetical protein